MFDYMECSSLALNLWNGVQSLSSSYSKRSYPKNKSASRASNVRIAPSLKLVWKCLSFWLKAICNGPKEIFKMFSNL